MDPAENSERGKRREKNHVAQPSVHQQMRQSKKRECDESRMTRYFEHSVRLG